MLSPPPLERRRPHSISHARPATPGKVRELVALMLWNLTCERSFHPSLLEADVTYTLLELLGSSSMQSMKKVAVAPQSNSAKTLGGSGGAGGRRGSVSGASSTKGTTPSSTLAGGATSDDHSGVPSGGGGESAEGSGGDGDGGDGGGGWGGSAADGTGAGGSGGGGLDTGGGGTGSSGGIGHAAEVDDKEAKGGDSSGKLLQGGGGGGVSAGVGLAGSAEADDAGNNKPSLQVRRNVLGAVMNLTSMSISDPRLDPKAVMSLLTLIMREDPNERWATRVMGGVMVPKTSGAAAIAVICRCCWLFVLTKQRCCQASFEALRLAALLLIAIVGRERKEGWGKGNKYGGKERANIRFLYPFCTAFGISQVKPPNTLTTRLSFSLSRLGFASHFPFSRPPIVIYQSLLPPQPERGHGGRPLGDLARGGPPAVLRGAVSRPYCVSRGWAGVFAPKGRLTRTTAVALWEREPGVVGSSSDFRTAPEQSGGGGK